MSEETPVPLPATPVPVSPRAGWFSLSSPIGLIGGFTAIVDVALILAATQIDDPVARLVMITFAAVAFFYVAFKAFWLLEHLPVVLYAPKDYGGTTTVEGYAEATNRNRALAVRGVKEFRTVKVDLLPLDQVPEPAAPALAEQTTLSDDFVPEPTAEPEQFQEGGYVTLVVGDEARRLPYFRDVETEEVKLGDLTKRIRYDPTQWIGEFIIEVSKEYRTLGYFSSPESYGLTWLMRDRKSGATLDEIGFVQEFGHGVATVDRRRLEDTEVLPGMELEPVELPPPAPYLPTSPDEFPAAIMKADTFDDWYKSTFGSYTSDLRRRTRRPSSPPS